MNCKDSVKWLENLKNDLGKSQFCELWHYEQALTETIELLKSDRFVELPCKVGDTVYEIMFGPVREIYFIEETTITAFHIKNNEILVDLGICRMTLNVRDFNRWFFTDKSKAQSKLKELNDKCQ